MQSTSGKHLYEFAVVRYVPKVERGEFVNVGLVMMCKRQRWLKVRLAPDADKIRALAPDADMEVLRSQLESFASVGQGDKSPIGTLEAHERFRWLTAVRSACISTSRPHPGKTADLDSTFDTLFSALVL